MELLPRSEAVLQMQADLVSRYSLSSDVYGPSDQRRLRVFPDSHLAGPSGLTKVTLLWVTI